MTNLKYSLTDMAIQSNYRPTESFETLEEMLAWIDDYKTSAIGKNAYFSVSECIDGKWFRLTSEQAQAIGISN